MENEGRDANENSLNAHQRAKALKFKQKGGGVKGMNSDYEQDDHAAHSK